MTRTLAVEFTRATDGAAGVGEAAGHTVRVDRPDGVAGGQGTGLNGGQLLAFSLGGCLWNDLHYAAAAEALDVRVLGISAEVDVEGDPMRLPAARVRISMSSSVEGGARRVFDRAVAASAVAAALRPGMRLDITLSEGGPS